MLKDYYLYLVKASWPALIGLFVIFVFLGFRLLQTVKDAKAQGSSNRRPWLLSIRVVISVLVLILYQDMFFKNYPDWVEKPGRSQGVVNILSYSQDNPGEYIVGIKDGERNLSFIVDKDTFDKLNVDDYIRIEFLPVKKNVISCTILTRQATKNI